MNKYTNVSNTELSQVIDDWVKSERDRKILKRKLIDGISYEKIAEEFDISVKQAFRITKSQLKILDLHTKPDFWEQWVTIGP